MKLVGVMICFVVCPVVALGSESSVPSAARSLELEEIIVTAQRRLPENLFEVPMSISVVTADQIEVKHLVGMNDYLRTLPSVNFLDRGAGRNTVIIRGISSDPEFDTDSVGVYIDETPVTGLGTIGQGHLDLKLVDIERVEVLRGPQGTLYGESSMGGTVRIIPAKPDLSGLKVSVAGNFSGTCIATR